jgi:toxin ParE1/3/4
MGERKINLSEKADEDLREIFNYVSENSLSAALAKIDLILARIELLKNFPRLGRVVQHFKNERLREILAGSYRIAYYVVSDEQIDILSIQHSSRPIDFNYSDE